MRGPEVIIHVFYYVRLRMPPHGHSPKAARHAGWHLPLAAFIRKGVED